MRLLLMKSRKQKLLKKQMEEKQKISGVFQNIWEPTGLVEQNQNNVL